MRNVAVSRPMANMFRLDEDELNENFSANEVDSPDDLHSEDSRRESLSPVSRSLSPVSKRKTSLSVDDPSSFIEIRQFAAADTVEGNCSQLQAAQDEFSSLFLTRQVNLRHFITLSVIGKGAYGKVFLVRKKGGSISKEDGNSTSNIYAMKVLRKAHIIVHHKDAEHTMNERSILQAVRHPFIVKLYYAFQTSAKLYLILSYAPGGELFTYLAQEKMFSEPTTCFYSGELLLALEHLHSIGIIYRDLKPENVLLNQDGHVMLTDFGLSKVALEGSTFCGTPEFMAPEIILEKTYDKTVDFWSLGVMIYDMLTGGPPFSGNNNQKIQNAILNKKLVFPNYMTSFSKDLCTKLLKKLPSNRLGRGLNGAKDIKGHSFFRKINWEKLEKLECEPPIRPTVKSAFDVSNFSMEFTSMPVETPPTINETEANSNKPSNPTTPNIKVNTSDNKDNYFKGFTYTHEGSLH